MRTPATSGALCIAATAPAAVSHMVTKAANTPYQRPSRFSSRQVRGYCDMSNATTLTLTSRGDRFNVMPREMKLRQVIQALRRHGCVEEDGSRHTKWVCPCREHSASIPRHRYVSPGVIGDTIKRMACLPEGWLQ